MAKATTRRSAKLAAEKIKKAAPVSLTTISRKDYETKLDTWNALREEIDFILTEAVRDASIKTHTIESRVKEYDSLKRKLQDRASGGAQSINDIVGARVICLFKSDLSSIGKIIEASFSVIEKDDKIESSEDSFGYMSVHYIAKMKPSHRGPRYNKIKGIVFEIQVRTLCMHAWAAISHYLDYKAEWDIPVHLRKGLNALSGLFYVADEQYERLYDARQESRESAESKNISAPSTATSINLDTVSAFLQRKYPDRHEADISLISKLVRELLESEYRTLEEVERAVDSAKAHLDKEDAKQRKDQEVSRPLFFNTAGAVRVSLSFINTKFAEAMRKSYSSSA